MRALISSFAAIVLAWTLTVNLASATSAPSYRFDSTGQAVNSTETLLTPSNVSATTFGKKFSNSVDGTVYAEPLYMPSVVISGGNYAGAHNLVFVATQHDSLYAIDADSGVVIWKDSFTTTALGLSGNTSITTMPSGDTNSTDTAPEIGICSTPVIDPSTKYLYCTAKTKQVVSGAIHYVYYLYKIDITNGTAATNSNIIGSTVIGDTIFTSGGTVKYTYRTSAAPTDPQDPFVAGTGDGAITVNGQSRVYFNAMRQMNRPALLLYAGNVYAGFASHGDNGPYHGWILGFNASTLAVTAVFNTTPNAGLGGIWSTGSSMVVDGNGYIYTVTGNGSFDGYNNNGVAAGLSNGFPVNGDYGDCFLKLAVDGTSAGNQNQNGWGLKVVDYFAPYNNQSLDNSDSDLGSGGPEILPDSAGSMAHPHLLVGAGKGGTIYLMDRDSMGKFTATTDNVVQAITSVGATFSAPAFYNGILYYFTAYDYGLAIPISAATMAAPTQTAEYYNWPGNSPVVSSSGTSNGIIWVEDFSNQVLRAYSAANFQAIYASSQAANNRDALPSAQKFASAMVADGHVFVGTTSTLETFGLLNTTVSSAPAAPSGLVATAVSSLQINLTWVDNSTNEAGFTVEQSSDGTNFSQIATVGANVTGYSVIQNLMSGTQYYFRIKAYNSYGGSSVSAPSNVATATTQSAGSTPVVSYPNGFAGSNLSLNGSAAISGSSLVLTNGGTNQAASAWNSTPVNIQSFTTTFTFQLTSAKADGFMFVIQNNKATTIEGNGGALGFAGMPKSVGIDFDLYSNTGENSDGSGMFTNGTAPYSPSTDLSKFNIFLNSGDVMKVTLKYDGSTLTETILDTVTSATASLVYSVNIPAVMGGSNTAYVGFTAGTGGLSAVQSIQSWTFGAVASTPPVAPSNLVATAVSGTQVNLTWSDNSNNESGFYIMRETGTSGAFTQIAVAPAGATTYADSGLTTNTTYTYEVSATNNAGTSTVSNASAVTTPVQPQTPTNAQATTITSTSIAMTWTDNANNETGYNVMRKMSTASDFSLAAQLPANSTGYTDTGLTPGTSYDYHIQAYNLAGYSDFSGFTAVTLPNNSLPIVSVMASAGAAVYNVATGGFTFTRSSPYTTALPVSYTISGTATGGRGYTALSGSVTIPAGAASAIVPVTALSGANANATVIVTIASTSTYTAGTPTSATVVLEPPTYASAATTQYNTQTVTGSTGGTVTLTFGGLPGNPSGAVYVWYLNGNAFATSVAGSYSITNAANSQSGTYSVYAWAPTGATGSESFAVTISTPPVTITTSTPSLQVSDGSTASFTVSLSSAPTSTTVVNVGISGTPAITVSPATISMTPTSYTNQKVVVTAAAINSNDSNRTATVALTSGGSSASVSVTDVVSDAQTASNLTATSYPLSGTNIGSGAGDSSVRASGNWWVDGSGAGGVAGTADSFHFESQSYTGNFQMIVQLQNLVATGATVPRAGLMVRDGSAGGSCFLSLAGTATSPGGYALDSRTAVNAASGETITSGTGLTYTYPNAWMMLTRVGNVLHAFVSSDGNTFTEVTNASTGVTWSSMSTALNIGVFSSSGNTSNTRAVMNGFSITAGSSTAPLINYPSGFASAGTAMIYNGSAKLVSGNVQVTDQGNNEAGSAWYSTAVNVQTFSTTFTLSQTQAQADGMCFVIQNNNTAALGNTGGGLGFANINKSVGIKFDIYSNAGEGNDSTGIYANGAAPFTPATDLSSSNIYLTSGDKMKVTLTYDGTTLTETIVDTVSGATKTLSYAVNIPGIIGGNTAWVGFTGGTGGLAATQAVSSWTYGTSASTPPPPPPGSISYTSGFGSAGSALVYNGSAVLSSGSLQLTGQVSNQAGSVWASTAVSVQKFTSVFTFQQTQAQGDGMMFVIQGVSSAALGNNGGGLGFAGINSSVGVKFDLYSNAGEGNDSTGLFSNGAAPFTPATDLSGSGIYLNSGDTMKVTLTYDGTTLTETIQDVITNASKTVSYTVNIPSLVGGNSAFVGFTGGTGGYFATQSVLTWTYASQ